MDRGLAELLRYNAWANRTLLEACRALSDDELRAAQPPTSESIAELLAHTVGAQENYMHHIGGEAFESALDRDAAWPGLDVVVRLADETSARLIAIAETRDPDDEVELTHHGALHRYPLRFLLANVIEHGIRHRSEVVRMLLGMAMPAPDLDGWGYGRFAGYGVTD